MLGLQLHSLSKSGLIFTVASLFCALSLSPVYSQTSADTGDEKVMVLTEPVQEIAGPKRVVSVGKFDAIGAFEQKYGDWDIGGGLSAMMTSALVESGRFIVVERANVQQVLAEQQMKGQNITSPTTGPELGQVTGLNFLIYGSVTEFGTDDQGGGFGLGVSTGTIGNLFSGGLSRQSASGKVAMDIRLVNATTSQVEEVYRVSEPIDNSSWDLSLGYEGVSLGTNQFYKTPLGEATRKAITHAVQLIAAKTNTVAWTGQVVDFDEGQVYINAGSSSGIQANDKFMVERVVKRLTDPQTGEVLMIRKKELGLVTVSDVLEKVSFGGFIPLDIDAPQRGDVIVLVR
ncbi:CsgG/HfaB family protein [Kiloniella laminariae]|uniref:CsgG/HfaB family protein n=1 Tax=Kiloniella laminariae TaxID=454162 RepID=UPI00037C8FCB|nr:CsgG/HfaB family protein [Kiloniella laminariae]